ncbi:hypothetical protein BGZ63DRAFT_253194 [Mariannaea sp. PMI_226]|nr:hypothetical protein BGZ63DRAFT_253194 [Mariannaea sp. PMI_226]
MSGTSGRAAPTRNDVINDAKAHINTGLNPGDWIEANSTPSWSTGLLGVDGHSNWGSLSSLVRRHTESFERDYSFAKYTTGSHTLGGEGRTVIGFRVSSHWHDETNGWFKVTSGGVGSSTVTIEFSSYKTRGCNWGVEAWTI